MAETSSEDPVLDTVAAMTPGSLARCGLDPNSLVAARTAALAAVDAPGASCLVNVGPAMDAGVTVEQVQNILIGVAPIRCAAYDRRCHRDHRGARDRRRRGRGRTRTRGAGPSILRRSPFLVLLVVAVTALSACGGSSTSSSSSTSSTAASTAPGSGGGVAAARQRCLDATKKIQNSHARSTAEQACNQITTSNANVSAGLSKAKQACLTAAAKIPIASVKQSAQTQCDKIAAP
jgi:hypothetical protein